MKTSALGMILAVVSATSSVAFAQDEGTPAGNVEKAASFAEGNAATIVAAGAGLATGVIVFAVGSSDGSNSTATATATTQ